MAVERQWQRRWLWLAAVSFLLVAAALLLSLTSLEDLAAEERRVLEALQPAASEAERLSEVSWIVVVRDVTALGSAFVIVCVTVLVSGYFGLRGQWRSALQLTVTAATGYGWSAGLKLLVARARPSVVPHLVEVASPSFPSGHALASAVVWLTLGAMLARRSERTREKIYCLGAAVLLTGLVGFSRMALGVHYPSDVLAGWLLGAAWAALCWMGFARWHEAVGRARAVGADGG